MIKLIVLFSFSFLFLCFTKTYNLDQNKKGTFLVSDSLIVPKIPDFYKIPNQKFYDFDSLNLNNPYQNLANQNQILPPGTTYFRTPAKSANELNYFLGVVSPKQKGTILLMKPDITQFKSLKSD